MAKEIKPLVYGTGSLKGISQKRSRFIMASFMPVMSISLMRLEKN